MADYISRELMIKEMQQLYEGVPYNFPNSTHTEWEILRGKYAAFIDYLKQQPAVDVQPVKNGRWITKAEDYYKAWQDSGRSWNDMPYFVTGLKFACSNCFEQYDVNAEGVEKWNGCPICLAKMDGEQNGMDT